MAQAEHSQQAQSGFLRPMLRPALRAVLGIFLIIGLAACTATFRNHGYVPTEAELAEISIGSDTKATVTEKVGQPGAAGVVGDAAWYYVQSRVESYAYSAPEVIERQVVAISFSSNGRVRNVERFGLADGEVIALNRRVTDSNIEGVSFLRQLLGSLGRIDAGQLLD
jgi:outer membrane protein assembly factor BamE (lipoprotein component of BamABCDE complex)